MENTITVTATFDDGVLYPDQPLALAPHQRVTLIVRVPETADPWPADVARIYQELAEDDCRLASAMFPTVRDTWPTAEEGT
jgi:hypothetical protein